MQSNKNLVTERLVMQYLLIIILVLAAVVRLVYIGSHPHGTYTDEAYGAYLAYGIMTDGVDDAGYTFPVYFTAWGSGMNALYIYIGALFFRLFGVSLTVYRLPQALCGILAIYALYKVVVYVCDQRTAILAAFALACNPWHIMMCRFGLESNLAPNLFLIALLFLVKGVQKNQKQLLLAACLLGISLYSYALLWLFLPLFLCLNFIYYRKYLPERKYLIWFCGILFIFAVPLFLFLAVNMGMLPEVTTSFFSIPKLSGFRGGELSLQNIKAGLGNIFRIIVQKQGDERPLLTNDITGAYYYFTTPLWIVGVTAHVCSLWKRRKETQNYDFVFLSWLIAAFVVSALQERQTMIHMNMMHISIIFYSAYGIRWIDQKIQSCKVEIACGLFYLFSFVVFLNVYQQMPQPDFFDEKPYEAVQAAKEYAGEDKTITIVGYNETYKYPNLLWQEKIPIRDYTAGRVMDDDPYFASLLEYDRYRYIDENAGMSAEDILDENSVYVMLDYQVGVFRQRDFQVHRINDTYAIAFMP